jgi:hypothetical protein
MRKFSFLLTCFLLIGLVVSAQTRIGIRGGLQLADICETNPTTELILPTKPRCFLGIK